MPEPVEGQVATTGTGSSGAGEAAPDRQARKAERTAAKQARKIERTAVKRARKAAKAAAKAAHKAARAAEQRSSKDAKAAEKEARSAARSAARQEQAAARASQEVGKADKSAAKQAKALARTQEAAAQAAEEDARRAAKAARLEARRAAKAAQKAARTAARASLEAPGSAADPAASAGVLPASAGAVLEEVAGLVRRTEEPPAARILDRVREPHAGADAEAEPEPERELVREPEPEPEAEPELVPEPEPEPELVPEPEPEPVREPEPVLEPEAAIAVVSPPLTPDAELDRDPVAIAVKPWPVEPEASPPASEADAAPAGEADPLDDGAADTPSEAPVEIPEGAAIEAAIDVGATSVHLLVAAIHDHRVIPLLDESAFLGLGDRVARDGRIGREARDELVATLVAYAARARQLGARNVTIVGTEPMRRALDTAALATAVEARAQGAFHVLDHDEEGLLMLLGVTLGRPLASSVVVIDVGGGSTEFVTIDPEGHVRSTGLPLGAARLTRDLVRGDPPSLDELEALKSRVREVLTDAPDLRPGQLVGVGGTASNLLKLLPATAVDRTLTRRRLTVALAMLTVERSADAAERHLLRPERARILPAGAIIVDAILERYGADRLRVSEEGIREGLALAVATAGAAWRDRLPSLARGWRESVETDAATT